MSEVKVNKISPRTNCGTTTLGDSGDSFIIPSGVTITNNGTQTGFGRTGTVDWQTGSIKTSDFTAVNTQGFFVDTNGGAVVATLPAGSAGAIISFQDYRNTFDTANLTITPNGSDKINGGAGSVKLTTEGEGITLVYIDSTVGWRSIQDNDFANVGSNFMSATGGTVTCSGNCRIHTFTGPGTFCVSALAVCAANNEVSYTVVAGGAAGSTFYGGGGGAGGFRESKSPVTPYTASPLDGRPNAPNRVTVTATSFPITVGGGGAVGGSDAKGGPGNTSTFSTISSAGGGGGGVGGSPTNSSALAGGSGGGGGSDAPGASPAPGAAGNTPPTSPAQGQAGGNGCRSPGTHTHGGGGGGATATGVNGGGPGSGGGSGGAGATTSINGSPTAFAGGGGGAVNTGGGGLRPSGGTGGGGKGYGPGGNAESGTANTGGGGGSGANGGSTGAGGSGIVIIRYKKA
tara:strand:- start:40 stop:1413 length:1374 start_codon:yes stop_codon:yes gene_type:complete